MLPNSREKHHIERKAELVRCGERGQPIIDPAYLRNWMQAPADLTKSFGGFSGHNLKIEFREPSGVAAGTLAGKRRCR